MLCHKQDWIEADKLVFEYLNKALDFEFLFRSTIFSLVLEKAIEEAYSIL